MTEAALPAPDKLVMEVILEVSFQVTVSLEATSDKTVDEVKELALKKYHSVGRSTFRSQFSETRGVYVGSEEAEVYEVKTTRKKKETTW